MKEEVSGHLKGSFTIVLKGKQNIVHIYKHCFHLYGNHLFIDLSTFQLQKKLSQFPQLLKYRTKSLRASESFGFHCIVLTPGSSNLITGRGPQLHDVVFETPRNQKPTSNNFSSKKIPLNNEIIFYVGNMQHKNRIRVYI